MKSTQMLANEFADLVRRSKLVDEGTLNTVLLTVRQRTADIDVDPYAIADVLVQAKLLTMWQADRLLDGQYDDFFLGHYKLLARLGGGTMGIVYLAEHQRMRRRAALKLLRPKFVHNPRLLEFFYQESEATAALDHPNVVRAYDVVSEGETYYLVMEYVDGTDFNELVGKRGPLHFVDAVDYIRQAADGLAHAHDQGIIHRDVKPANLMLDLIDRVKILDLGLSRWERIEAAPSVSKGRLIGTPSFMAPEQSLGGAQADVRSDIYSLGCTFYFLLTGSPPFTSDTVTDLFDKHFHEHPPTLTESVPDVPHELEEIYLRMMAKRPEDRFNSAADVRTALGACQTRADAAVRSAAGRKQAAQIENIPQVLVADDDEVTRQMLVGQLNKAGFETRAASDGQQAMDMMDSDVDVCLIDLNMPRATGMDCLRHVHCHFPATPVIILTASDEIRDAVVAMREGAFDYLTKPCQVRNMLTRVEEAIRVGTRIAEDGASLKAVIDSDQTIPGLDMETIFIGPNQQTQG